MQSTSRLSRNRGRAPTGYARSTSQPAKKGSMLPILLVMAIVYFATAGWTGRWVAKKVIAPAMSWGQKITGTPRPIVMPSPTPKTTLSDVRLAGFTLYTLQTGLFQSKTNADQAADAMNISGRLGAVVKSPQGFRVLVSASVAEEDTLSVMGQFAQSNVTTQRYNLTVPTVTLRLSGNAAQCLALEKTLANWRKVCLELGNAAVAQEAGSKGALAQKASELAKALRISAAGMVAEDMNNIKLKAADCSSQLEALSVMKGNDNLAPARKLQIEMTADLLASIEGFDQNQG